jgi:hypothetical protein
VGVPVKTTVKGAWEVRRALARQVPKEVRKATRAAVDEAGKIVLAAEKTALTARRTGALKKSLGRKTVARKSGDGYTAVIGPRRDPSLKRIERSEQEVAAGKRKKALKGGRFKRAVKFKKRTILVNPANYAHLVEFGRKAVRAKSKKVLSDGGTFYGKSVDRADARPFRAPALRRSTAAIERALQKRTQAAVATAGKR